MNNEERKAYSLKYYAEHKDKLNAYSKQYQKTHKIIKQKKQGKWWELSPEEKIVWANRGPKVFKPLKKVIKPFKKTISNSVKFSKTLKPEPDLGFFPQLPLMEIERIIRKPIKSDPGSGFLPQLPLLAIDRIKSNSTK